MGIFLGVKGPALLKEDLVGGGGGGGVMVCYCVIVFSSF